MIDLMILFEKIILLRTLNYLRVTHRDSRTYNYIIPIFLTFLVCILILVPIEKHNIYGTDGLLQQISSILVILSPFYIAALAAVSTFNGNDELNKTMRGIQPPQLSILEKGEYKEVTLILRHFLCLMFGYCSLLSLILFFSSVFIRYLAKYSYLNDHAYSTQLGVVFFVIFIFFLMQLVIVTLLGLYFLSDKLHRPS